MRQGTTPTHIFRLPFSTDMVSKVKVIYAQNNTVIFTKEGGACEYEEDTVKVRLTQEETLKFDCAKHIQIQIRVLTLGGDALTSEIKLVSVEKCLESEVLE